MPGLDPGIHEARRQAQPYDLRSLPFIMDCRVKPGNDAQNVTSSLPESDR
jgi:hypothetical protein